jgi:ppGpp synthetase/RelA/SpoT-type nucleotidyltranferase
LNYATIQAAKAKDAAKSNDLSRVVKGSYKEIIDLMEQQFGLEAGSISIHTVKSRLKKNRRLTASVKGKCLTIGYHLSYFH